MAIHGLFLSIGHSTPQRFRNSKPFFLSAALNKTLVQKSIQHEAIEKTLKNEIAPTPLAIPGLEDSIPKNRAQRIVDPLEGLSFPPELVEIRARVLWLEFPEEILFLGSGSEPVTLRTIVTISQTGRVETVEFIEGDDFPSEKREIIEQAIFHGEYSAAFLNGQAVRSYILLEISVKN